MCLNITMCARIFHLNALMNYLICCTSFLSNAPIQYRQRQKISITALHDTYARLKFSNSTFWTLIWKFCPFPPTAPEFTGCSMQILPSDISKGLPWFLWFPQGCPKTSLTKPYQNFLLKLGFYFLLENTWSVCANSI